MAYSGPTFLETDQVTKMHERRFDELTAGTPLPSDPLHVEVETDKFSRMLEKTTLPSDEARTHLETERFHALIADTPSPSQQFLEANAPPEGLQPPVPAALSPSVPAPGGLAAPGASGDGPPADDPIAKTLAFLRGIAPGGQPAAAAPQTPGIAAEAPQTSPDAGFAPIGAVPRAGAAPVHAPTGQLEPTLPGVGDAIGQAADAGGDLLVGQMEQANTDRAEVRDHFAAMTEKMRRGEPITDEERARGLELVAPMAMGATEPLKAVGAAGKVAGAVGEAITPAAGSAWAAIRAGRAEAPAAAAVPLSTRLETVRRGVVRAFTDRAVDLGEFQKKAQATLGRPLHGDEMVLELSKMNPDMAARVRVDEQVKPLLARMGGDTDLVSDLLTARNNVDQATALGARAERGEAGTGADVAAGRAFSGGATSESSGRAISEMEAALGPERFAQVGRHADEVTGLYRGLLEEKVKAGLVSREAADGWLRDYPNYVKTEITDYLKTEMDGGGAGGSSLSVRANGIKRLTAEGTERVREDPIASLVREFYDTERLVKRNTTFNAFANLRESVPGMDQLFREVPNGYAGTNKERTVTGFVDGERKTYMTSSPEMAKVLRQEGVAPIPVIAPMMQLFKELITSRNPAFLVGNAMIDFPAALVRESVRAGGPTQAPKVTAALVRGYIDAFKGVTTGEFSGSGAAAYLKGGGGMGRSYDATTRTSAQTLAELGRPSPLTVNSAADVKRIVIDLLKAEPVVALGERVELGPRIAAYRLAQGRGVAEPAAIRAGRTTTVDFTDGGYAVKWLNQVVPFLNPAVQGSMALPRTVAENPRAAAMVAGAGLVAPTLLAEVWNRSDEQRARDYADVPQYIKDRGLVFMLPGEVPVNERGEREPQHIDVNLRQLSVVTTTTRTILGQVVGDDFRGWANLAKGLITQVSPLTTVDSVLPPGISTALELSADRDLYRNRPIATDRGDENASALSHGLADVTGARPSQVDFATRDLGGFAAQAAHGASDYVMGRTRQSGTPQDIPVAGAFIRRVVRGDTGERLSQAQDRAVAPALLSRLKSAGVRWSPTPVGSSITGVLLRKPEQERYQILANRYTNEALREVLSDPDFRAGNAFERDDAVRSAVAKAHADARSDVLDTIPDAEERKDREQRRRMVLR